MADHDYKEGGWTDKYLIAKRCPECGGTTAGPCTCDVKGVGECTTCQGHGYVPVDPAAVYFVLRLDEDPHARAAAIAYANSVQRQNPQFAMDIRAKVDATRKPGFEI